MRINGGLRKVHIRVIIGSSKILNLKQLELNVVRRLINLLHITNPCLIQIHSFWQKIYRLDLLINALMVILLAKANVKNPEYI